MNRREREKKKDYFYNRTRREKLKVFRYPSLIIDQYRLHVVEVN